MGSRAVGTRSKNFHMKESCYMGSRAFWILVIPALLVFTSGCTKEAKQRRALAWAERDFASERYDRAEIEYLAALRIPPPHPTAVAQLGRIYSLQGKYPQAYVYLQKAAELNPESVDIRARLASACVSLGKLKEARQQALQALDKQPQDTDALQALVESTVATNQVPETLKRLETVPAGNKLEAGYRLARATFHLRLLELDQAEVLYKAVLASDPKSIPAYLGLGAAHLLRTNLADAEAAFKAAADVAPTRSIAHLRYAELKLKTGAPDVARKTVEEITAKAPDYIPAWIFLAQMAFAEQKRESCSKLIDTVLGRDPINLEALVLKGNLLLVSSDPTNALAQFEKVQSFYGKIPAVQYRMALAQLQKRETAKARNTLNDLLSTQPGFPDAVLLNANLQIRAGDGNSAILTLSKFVKDQPRLFQAYVYLAEAYLSQKRLNEATSVYQQAVELFPSNPEAEVTLGALYLQQEKKVEAKNAFEKALKIAPDYLLAQEKLIDMELAEHNLSGATALVQNYIAAKPAAAEPRLLLAKVHIASALEHAGVTNVTVLGEAFKAGLAASPAAQAEVIEAENVLLKAIDLNPNLGASYFMLAQLYVRAGRHLDALERLDVLARTNDLRALMQIGIIQTELTNYAAARNAYEKILGESPNASPALNNLAYLYAEHLGDLDKAYQLARRARDLLPHDPRTADTLGWVLCKRGDFGWALALLQEAAAKMALDPEVQYHLGMAHYMSGEEDSSRAAFERAVRIRQDFQGNEEVRKRLRVLNVDPGSHDAATSAELRQLAARDPDDSVVLLRLAALEEHSNNFVEAGRLYERILKRNPQNTRAQFKLAKLYHEKLGEPVKALALAKEAHSALPENAEISVLLGRLAYGQGDYSWAVSLLQDGWRKLPGDSEVIYDLAMAQYSLGQTAEAEVTMQSVWAGGSFSRQDRAKLFLKLVGAARTGIAGATLAIAEARSILEMEPDYVPALMLVALAEEHKREFSAAKGRYEKVLSIYPLFAPAAKNLALLFAFEFGDDQKAYELALKAREAYPKDCQIARLLGILTYRRADYDRALRFLDQSLEGQEDDPQVQFYKGMAHYRLKQLSAAQLALQRALRLELDLKSAEEARKALTEVSKSSRS